MLARYDTIEKGMTDYISTFNELSGKIDIDAYAAADASELVFAAERAATIGASTVLVDPSAVHTIWAWLETKGISIFALQKVERKHAHPTLGEDHFYMNLIASMNAVM